MFAWSKMMLTYTNIAKNTTTSSESLYQLCLVTHIQFLKDSSPSLHVIGTCHEPFSDSWIKKYPKIIIHRLIRSINNIKKNPFHTKQENTNLTWDCKNKPGSQPKKEVAFQALDFLSQMYTEPEPNHKPKLTFSISV